jgi:hypothetical protein
VTTCAGPDCARPKVALGLCSSHYRQQRLGRPLTPLRSYGAKGCSVDGCEGQHLAHGLCRPHWQEQRRPRPRWRQRTTEEVQEIRRLHAAGVSFEELGRRFGCSASTAARICKGWSFPDST